MQQVIIPNFDIHKIANPDGTLDDSAKLMLSQLIQALQQHLSPNGLRTPKQDTDTITSLNTSNQEGVFLYDKTTKKMMVNINGTFKEIQTV